MLIKSWAVCMLVSVLWCSVAIAAEAPVPIADSHAKAGMGCSVCHVQAPPAAPMDQCLSCHGPHDKLIQATKAKHFNPHEGHFGQLNCSICHRGHSPDVNYCAECHDLSK